MYSKLYPLLRFSSWTLNRWRMMRKHFPEEEDVLKLNRTWAKEEQGKEEHDDVDEKVICD